MKISYKNTKFHKNSLHLICLINQILDDYSTYGYQLTLRQVYYQLVARGHIENNEKNYHKIGNVVNNGRLAGQIDWGSIVDRTRVLRKNSHWNNPEEIIDSAAYSFALDKWENQPEYIEVWVEKDALVDIVGQVCSSLDVPYFSCRGYTSQSEMQTAAQRILRQKSNGKTCHIIHLGDHDPSGIDMSRDIEDRTNDLFGAEVEIKRIALTMSQVKAFNPPPNPAKLSDTRSEKYISQYGEQSWELDALEPSVLSKLITDSVLQYRDDKIYEEDCLREAAYKSELNLICDNYQEVIKFIKARNSED